MEFNLSEIDLSQFTNLDKIGMAVVIFILFLWLVCIISVAKDVSARTDSHAIQIISILFVTFLTPIIWLPLYLAIRPVWYKIDKTPWRDSCANSSVQCESCLTMNPKEYDCCIQCGKKLKIKCKECEKSFPKYYHYCPYCGAPNINI